MRYLQLLIFVLFQFVCFTCQSIKEDLSHLPPEENRFTTSVLSTPGDFDEPMAFTFLNNREILIAERKGGVKSFDVETRETKAVGLIPVNTFYVNKEGKSRAAEEGLVGIIADPNFDQNHWIYTLYADLDEPKHVLVRWEYIDGALVESSKKVVLEYPVQRQECCHTGGGMVFDKAGNLYITTGNNTVNPPAGTSNLDERPGHENSDDQRTGGNTNDLRGKILRIHPEDDGSYTIPAGNLFPEGTPNTRPEIYTMGHRNPWRVSIDHQTGYIYWGEVGPDASEDTENGPKGYDEFNQAKGPGFFGWPYFIADNKPYVDASGKPFDVNQPENQSPNNTGLKELPAPQKAFIWYPYGYSEVFPALGSAGRSATGGPVFRQADFPESDKRFPAYYEGKWLIVDFMRAWIMAVTMDENGDYQSMEPFLPNENFSSAIDMQFSPDGDLYILEYGSAWFRGNENAQIKRVQYNGGNRVPVVKAKAAKFAGSVPLQLDLSSEGTIDYDKDPLKYEWTVASDNGFSETLKTENPSITLEKEGLYQVQLVVTDSYGNQNEQTFDIIAGNEPPTVDIQITGGNQSFFFPGSSLDYTINVTDKEDGSVETGAIPEESVAINFDYVPEGFDPIEIAQNHRSTDEWVVFSKGKTLIEGSDCLSCHRMNERSIGPSYQEIAAKYKDDPQIQGVLAQRIIKGSVGLWGDHAMSAHPDLSERDAGLMVEYIMSLEGPEFSVQKLALSGSYTPQAPETANGKGGYLLRAAYTDKGAAGLETITSEKIIALRNPIINPEQGDVLSNIQIFTTPRRSIIVAADSAYIGLHDLDLSGLSEVVIKADVSDRISAAGGIIELRLGAPDGRLIATSEPVKAVEIDIREEVKKRKAAWEKGGKKGPEPNRWRIRDLLRPKYSLALGGIQGRNDIYFVFRSPEAKAGQTLMQLFTFEFKNKQSPL